MIFDGGVDGKVDILGCDPGFYEFESRTPPFNIRAEEALGYF